MIHGLQHRSPGERGEVSSLRVANPRKGFSLVEVVVVVAIAMIMTAVAIINILGALKNAAADSAQTMIVENMRFARQRAISDRRVYRVTFSSPSGISLDIIATSGTVTNYSTAVLPSTVSMECEAGIPTTAATVPDGFGAGVVPVDFNSGQNQIYFQPDGAGRDSTGKIESGVIYAAIPGQVSSARAVTLFGSTGRIRAWKIYNSSGSWLWQ